jgi:hypothetical protein
MFNKIADYRSALLKAKQLVDDRNAEIVESRQASTLFRRGT